MRKLILSAAVAALSLAGLAGDGACATVLLSEDFTSDVDPNVATNKTELENKGWVFNDPLDLSNFSNVLEFGDGVGNPITPGGDDYLRTGGDTLTAPSADYAFGQDVLKGSLTAKIGSASSFAGAHLRIMDGATELANLRLQSRTKVFVKGDTEDAYNTTTVGAVIALEAASPTSS